MLNHLRHIRLMAAPNLPRCALRKVRESTIHPVLPKDTDTIAERRKVRLNHAERSVDRPENEEDDEQMVRIPEAFELRATMLLSSRPAHGCQRDEHNVAAPSGSRGEIGDEEADEAEAVDLGEDPEISPMGDGVEPGEEEDGPADELVEGDIFVEGNDAVEWGATRHGDQVSADGEQDESYVHVEG